MRGSYHGVNCHVTHSFTRGRDGNGNPLAYHACVLEFALPVQHDLLRLIRVKTPRPEIPDGRLVSIQHL